MGKHLGHICEKTLLLNTLALVPRECLLGHYSIDKLIYQRIQSQVSARVCRNLPKPNLILLMSIAAYVPLNLQLTGKNLNVYFYSFSLFWLL